MRYTYFSSLLPLAFCLKPITFVPQQTEKRYINFRALLGHREDLRGALINCNRFHI
ncbi:unknown protein [Microcystis aeruginosa NIES-843]|uniref:Uncharacterized protein n=1 Tax=Microcystis aeruginosa (strain NIES-843 / IAM M-2473) TaxID=449447 RepID=B0JSX6_MICAN|nr:unknown protein [Microcystis aeruginosa NIES-843]